MYRRVHICFPEREKVMGILCNIHHEQYAWRIAQRIVLWIGIQLLFLVSASAQQMNPTYQQYIRTYAEEAVRQMKEHKIPASVTMAQGLLESGAGKSSLASVHNNHFGIKCHKTWQGARTYRTDDAPNECFRSYENAKDSYRDHSYFLKQPRYRSLYDLNKTDYRGWAKGLQRAGYATDKGYANKLIALVELYELYELDRGRYPTWMRQKQPQRGERTEKEESISESIKHEGFISYGLLYVIAQAGDTFTSIAREMGLNPDKVAEWNDASIDFPLHKGDIVYLQRKNKRATEEHLTHTVVVGDSMHSISQRYGIRVERLYKMNHLDINEYVPEEGDVLLLR